MSVDAPSKRKATTILHGQELMCKNGCGFFGNPEWLGYCSKCHREVNQKKTERLSKVALKKVQRSHSDAQESLSLAFSKFEEKKKQQAEKRTKTIKSIMKRGQTTKESTNQSPSRDTFTIGDMFFKDLLLKDSVTKDIIKQIQKQLEFMGKFYDKSIDEQSEAMQDFYNLMFNRCETHQAYADMSPEQVDQLMDRIENQIMQYLHASVTQQIASEYEEKDLALQKRIRSLNWITSQHLGLNITESSPEVRDLIDKAIADVIQMDAKIAPQKKIKCIVNCSKSIFNLINLCQGVTASADEFLPAMVYIVLKANPPLLQSNIKYITSYSIPTRLRSGEGAYYFTNLCCAVAFIEDLTAESLNMNDDEFQRYLSGEIPQTYVEQSATDCEGLRLMTQNLITLTEMQDKNNRLLCDMDNLKDDMLKFQETLQKCKSISPIKLNPTPYTVPANTDMGLIPEILRSRVQLEGPVEDILVDIDSQIHQLENSETGANLSDDSSQVTVDLSEFASSHVLSEPFITTDTSSVLQPLQVLLPVQCNSVDSSASKDSSHSLCVFQNFSQPSVNIKDLDYPTELFPDKSEESCVEFGPFESCDPIPEDTIHFTDPLSPEAGLIEENMNLPPPLQPVIVQSTGIESVNRKM